MVKNLVLFLVLLNGAFSAAQTSEAECQSVDYRSEFPMKIRDQKSLAWCFAHAAADNLQFIEKAPVQISAADIAINYGNSGLSKVMGFFQPKIGGDQERPNEFGLAKFASQATLKEGGYCPEEYFPSDYWQKIESNGVAISTEISSAINEIYNLADLVRSGKVKSITDLSFHYAFKKIDKNLFYTILTKVKKDKVMDYLRHYACESVRIPFQNKIDVRMHLNSRNMPKLMNESLNNGNSFSIDLNFAAFENIENAKSTLTNLHTVVVYGRKYDSKMKQCVYLIKNSFSENCSSWYDARLNCNKGYLWFPESTLQQNMTSAVFYQ